MSHIRTSHVTRTNEACHTYERDMSHVWMHLNRWEQNEAWVTHYISSDVEFLKSHLATKFPTWSNCRADFWEFSYQQVGTERSMDGSLKAQVNFFYIISFTIASFCKFTKKKSNVTIRGNWPSAGSYLTSKVSWSKFAIWNYYQADFTLKISICEYFTLKISFTIGSYSKFTMWKSTEPIYWNLLDENIINWSNDVLFSQLWKLFGGGTGKIFLNIQLYRCFA